MKRWIKKALTRTLKVEGSSGSTREVEDEPSDALVYGVTFAAIALASLTTLQIAHMVFLGRWSSEHNAEVYGDLWDKYGGHEDQLSRKFWGMDIYRVQAMEKMLQQYDLTPEDQKATIEMLCQKCDILANGFFKRGKVKEGQFYLKLKSKY